MKKSLLTLATVLLAVAAQAQISHNIRIGQNSLSFRTISAPDGNNYSEVILQGVSGSIYETGNPKLPVQTIHLMIPFGKAVTNVTCSNVVKKNFQVNNPVYPAESYDSIRPVFTSPNTTVYNSNNIFPSTPIVGFNQGYFDGNNNIVSIDFCPFEYYPASGQLKQIVSATLTVNYTDGFRGGIQNISRLQKTQNLYDALLYLMVDNPEVIPDFRIAPNIVEDLGYTSSGLPVYEYVVIAPSAFENHPDLNAFVAWKRQKGYRAGIVTVEEILQNYTEGDLIGTYPIHDDAGSLRQYLHDAYCFGTQFALLLGDPNCSLSTHRYIPIRYGCASNNPEQSSYYFNRPTTDWYFSDLLGDWKKDTDDNYGEPNDDAANSMASISVGRILCFSDQELSNWVNKELLYEKNPGNGNANYVVNSLITKADGIGEDNYASLLTHFIHTTLEELPSYNSPNPYFPKGSDIINELNSNSYGIMTWFNHGGTNSQHSCMVAMSAYTGYSNSFDMWKFYSDNNCIDNGMNIQPDSNNSLDCLTNYNKPFIIYSQSCNVIPFDHTISNSSNQARNCGESFTVGGMYGGVAFMGNTTDASGQYHYSFANALNSAYNNVELSHLGNLENQSKHNVNYILWPAYHYKHNLIGDPECQIWTKVPQNMNVNVQASNMIRYVQGNVRVNIGGLPLGENVTVTLYSENDIFQIQQFVVEGHDYVEFDSVYPTTTNPIVVTVTCYNFLPYQTLLPVTQMCSTEIITNETWQTNVVSDCDIIVKPNAILTVKCKVSMNVDCKIIVEPGGRLILDGGELCCSVEGQQWQGVKVNGTGGNGWQGLIQGQYQQGFVSLKNNAQIRNARVALDLWDGINFSTTGGIVSAKNAIFRNNGIALRVRPFNNINPVTQKIHDYSAQFYNCDFIVDNEYVGLLFSRHIDLMGVRGVKFNGCDFILLNCPSFMCSEYNYAIYSYNSGFKVDYYCPNTNGNPCLENDYIKCVFYGFNMAINALQVDNTSTCFTVKNARFENNAYGIRSFGNTNPTILFNDFNMGNNGYCGIGVYLQWTPSFCIEENNFTKFQNNMNEINYFGIIVENSEGQNEIYKNTFTNLTCANLAIGSNHVRKDIQKGLSYCCNENNNNMIDFYIQHTDTRMQGIQQYQGCATLSSGNTFSHGAMWHIFNDGDYTITYYFNSNNPAEIPHDINLFNVKPRTASASNECPSHYSNGVDIPVLSRNAKQQLEEDYDNAYNAYINMDELYNNYVDGGSTEDELGDIAAATPSMMWELRSQLLNHSPFLSQESLRAATDREDVLPETVQFEILAANPEELGRDSLLSHVENKGNMPSYMINTLKALGSGSTTYKSILESQMSKHCNDFNLAAYDIVRSTLNDTLMDFEELRTWLGNLEGINAYRQTVSSYIMEGNYEQAFTTANAIPVLYELKEDELIEHEDYLNLLGLFYILDQQNRTILELTDVEMSMIDSIATLGIGVPQKMAARIVEYLTGVPTVGCPRLDLIGRGNVINSAPIIIQPNLVNELFAKVNPNPATTWVSVDYELPNKTEDAFLVITNMLGVKVKIVELHGGHGQRVVDCRDMANGVYIYTLYCGPFQQSGKLIITK